MSNDNNAELNTQELDKLITMLRDCVKKSTATDEFPHIDLSLVSAQKRSEYEQALKKAYQLISKSVITKEEFNRRLFEV
jgi:hypothetical protein